MFSMKKLVILICLISILISPVLGLNPNGSDKYSLIYTSHDIQNNSNTLQYFDDCRVNVTAYYADNYSYTIASYMRISPYYIFLEYFPTTLDILAYHGSSKLVKVETLIDFNLYSIKNFPKSISQHQYLNKTSAVGDNVTGYVIGSKWVWGDYDTYWVYEI
jgi:hypothetical protein